MSFLRHAGIYRSDVVHKTLTTWGGDPPPDGRPLAPVAYDLDADTHDQHLRPCTNSLKRAFATGRLNRSGSSGPSPAIASASADNRSVPPKTLEAQRRGRPHRWE